MKNVTPNFELPCFFCNKGIDSIKKKEGRKEWDDYYEYTEYYTVVIPVEKDVCTLSFKPTYISLLKYQIQLAEKKTSKILRSAIEAGENAISQVMEQLGKQDEIKICVKSYNNSPKGISENLKEFYSLKDAFFMTFADRNTTTNDYVLKSTGKDIDVNPRGFKAHGSCVKPEIILEELVNNPLLKDRMSYKLDFPGPYKNIYEKIKHEKVKVIAKKFDFRDYLKGCEDD
jgi:hypothetical protein